MKIKQDLVEQMRGALQEYIKEYGELEGKFMFSKELGIIENMLYTEEPEDNFALGAARYGSIKSQKVEGELQSVDEDPNLIPFLEVV